MFAILCRHISAVANSNSKFTLTTPVSGCCSLTLSIGKIQEFTQLTKEHNNEPSKRAEATNQPIGFEATKQLFIVLVCLYPSRPQILLLGCMGGTIAQIPADAEPPGSLRPRDEGTMFKRNNSWANWSLEGKSGPRGYVKSLSDGELPGATREQ